MFEILHCLLVRLSSAPRRKRSQIAAPAGLGIFLSGIQAILSGFKFSYHNDSSQIQLLLDFLVRAAFRAALRRDDELRLRAADVACRDRDLGDAAA